MSLPVIERVTSKFSKNSLLIRKRGMCRNSIMPVLEFISKLKSNYIPFIKKIGIYFIQYLFGDEFGSRVISRITYRTNYLSTFIYKYLKKFLKNV